MEIKTETDLGMSVPPVSSDIREGVVPRSSTPIVLIVVITGKITRPTHPPTKAHTHTEASDGSP